MFVRVRESSYFGGVVVNVLDRVHAIGFGQSEWFIIVEALRLLADSTPDGCEALCVSDLAYEIMDSLEEWNSRD